MGNTQYRKNLKDLATACKNYVDETKEQILWQVGQYDITTQDDNTTAYQKVVPTGATRCKIKRIYGLTQKLNPTAASDSTSYSVKTMPATIYDFDISKVEGNSEKSENKIVIPNISERTSNGITYRFENGTMYFNGTATGSFMVDLLQYCTQTTNVNIKFFDIQGTSTKSSITVINSNYSAPTTTGTSVPELTAFRFFTDSGQSFNNYSLKVMVVSGSTPATNWSLGFTGIHNFAWTGVKVEGANLFDNDNTELINRTFSGANQNIYAYTGFRLKSISLIKGRTYTIASTKNMYLGFTDSLTNSGAFVVANSYTFTATTQYVLVTNHYADQYEEIFENLMLNYGSTALDYTPYITPTTKTIDLSSILYNGSPLFESNSLKAVNDVKDILTPYKATKKLGYVDLGSLTVDIYNAERHIFSVGEIANLKQYQNTTIVPNIVVSGYTAVSQNDTWTNGDISVRYGTNNVYICDTNYSTAEAFKTAMNGVYLVYELETPIEVSINWASLLRGITGYNNGTITLVNTNNQDTANLITYNSIIKENCCAKMVQSRGGNVVKTINLPTQASDGYSAGSQYNYRDLTTSKRIGNVSKESNLGSLTWALGTGQTPPFYTPRPNDSIPNSLNLLSALYTAENQFWTIANNWYKMAIGNSNLNISNPNYADGQTFKTAMANEPLYYELADASKTETSIDSVDNVIEVEPNDVLSFYNSDDELVTIPSDLTYRIEVAR